MAYTMKDIARDLGVSVVTVSKVLRNHEDISKKTRKRVLDRVKQVNYRPNLAARGLVTGRSYLVGLIVPDLVHPFFAEVAKEISRVLVKKGYYLIIASSEEEPELEERELNQMFGRRLDAFIVASCCSTPHIFEGVEKQSGPPFVLIDRQFSEFNANFVGMNEETVGSLATEHLISIGCTRIAHLRGPNTSPGIGRVRGYFNALNLHGISQPKEYLSDVQPGDVGSRENGATAMRALLKLKTRPDGVFCYNDPMAIGAIKVILESGLRIPQDVAVIGCGNLHYDDALQVPLSSVDQNTKEIGMLAAKITLSLIESKKKPKFKTSLVEPRIVVRNSSERSRGFNEGIR